MNGIVRTIITLLCVLWLGMAASAQTVTKAVDVAVDRNNNSYVLLLNSNGSSTLKVLTPGGTVTFTATYGPYSGETAAALSVGQDGLARILWVGSTRTLTVWAVNPATGAAYYGPFYGPYTTSSGTPWNPVGIATGSDNLTRVLWTSPDGFCTFWTMDESGHLSYSPAYGPYAGYGAVAIAAGYNTARLLWRKTDNSTTFWNIPSTLAGTGNATYSVIYTPPAGFAPTGIAIDGAGTNYLLFNSIRGQVNLWSVAASNTSYTPNTSQFYALYHPWLTDKIAVSSVNTSTNVRLLWNSPGDTSTLWTLGGTGLVASSLDIGPVSTDTVGTHPQAALLSGTEGFLYGTTQSGGTGGHGTVFRTDTAGSAKVLYTFGSVPDGAGPAAGLTRGADGSLYGTTQGGGVNGTGTVFKISPYGVLTVLHSFGPGIGTQDGVSPRGRLLLDDGGVLVGVTFAGGTFGQGTVYRINPDGTGYVIVHNFNANVEAANPSAGIIQVAAFNNFYYGVCLGTGTGAYARGGVFRMNFNGTTFGPLHTFTGGTDGSGPNSELTYVPANRSLYGTTLTGGGNGNIFKIDSFGTFSGVYSFSVTDGLNPAGGPLFVSTDGNLYGAATFGGASGRGVLYRLNIGSGVFANVHSFAGTEGANPIGCGLVLGTDNYLYGTAQNGGANNLGTVFRATTSGTVTNLHSF